MYFMRILFKLNVIVIKWQPKVFCAVTILVNLLFTHLLTTSWRINQILFYDYFMEKL